MLRFMLPLVLVVSCCFMLYGENDQSKKYVKNSSNVNDDGWLYEKARDTRTYWYDKESLPEAYQSNGGGPVRLYKLGYNIAGVLDKTGSANNELPWLHTGGLDDCENSYVKRMLWLPKNKKIVLNKKNGKIMGGQRNGLEYSFIAGEYPIGTVSAEFLYDGDRLFEARSRVKNEQGWTTFQFEYGDKPVGYIHVSSCIECHEDIGKHSFELDAKRDWYGTVRGLEPGGPIHWHPWDTSKVDGVGTTPKIRHDVRGMVEDVFDK
ncbi:hypothetical protein N9045_00315 [bacterium]|nr:hypothetical protein [bacterium]